MNLPMEKKAIQKQMSSSIAVCDVETSLVEIRSNNVKYPRLKSYSQDDAVKGLTAIVLKAMMYKGQDAEQNYVLFIARTLYDELMCDHTFGVKYITLEEIDLAVRKAILTSDVYGISVASLYKIIVDYAKTEGHNAQKKVLMPKVDSESTKRLDELHNRYIKELVK